MHQSLRTIMKLDYSTNNNIIIINTKCHRAIKTKLENAMKEKDAIMGLVKIKKLVNVKNILKASHYKNEKFDPNLPLSFK